MARTRSASDPSGDRAIRGRGVVLVDIIVAVVLLGVALAALLGMANRSLTAQSQGERLQIAAMLLDEQLNLVLMQGPDDYETRFGVEGPCDPPFSDYKYRLDITGGAGGEAFSVKATVSWFEAGQPRSESVQTLIAPRVGEEPDPDRRPKTAVERESL